MHLVVSHRLFFISNINKVYAIVVVKLIIGSFKAFNKVFTLIALWLLDTASMTCSRF